jgi:hypothetical protein
LKTGRVTGPHALPRLLQCTGKIQCTMEARSYGEHRVIARD